MLVNSNTYIIVYSTVMVVIVATLRGRGFALVAKASGGERVEEKKAIFSSRSGTAPTKIRRSSTGRWPISTARSNPSSSMPTA